MNISATDATEITDYIAAEQIIEGAEITFKSLNKEGDNVTFTGTEIIRRINQAVALGASVREIEGTSGQMIVQLYCGGSAYGTYARI